MDDDDDGEVSVALMITLECLCGTNCCEVNYDVVINRQMAR